MRPEECGCLWVRGLVGLAGDGGPGHVDYPVRPQVLGSERQGAAKPNRPAFKCELCLACCAMGVGVLCAAVSLPVRGDFNTFLPGWLWELKE